MSLEALERSDLSRLPGGIFTRAFIRAYAQEVGLDPDRMIQDFIAELPPEAATITSRAAVTEDGEQLDADRRAVATGLRLVLFAVPIVGLVVYYGTHRVWQSPMPAPAVVESPVAQSPPALPAAAPPAGAPVVPEPAVETAPVAASTPAPTGLTMEITTTAACWVSATVDGAPTFSGVMGPGERKILTARDEIVVTAGDAGAFAYKLNGSPGRPLGAPGEVASKRITFATYKDYIAP
jgi:cytoskeleton protein RodZ